jgi:hypothetical protein
MKKCILLMLTVVLIACSTEKEQLETLRILAKNDVITQLDLPEGTKFNDTDIVVDKQASDLEDIAMVYVVKVTIKSQDQNGNEVLKTHTLKYQKIGEGGLDPNDYELTSFD